MSALSVNSGDFLFREGDPARGLIVIMGGSVAVFSHRYIPEVNEFRPFSAAQLDDISGMTAGLGAYVCTLEEGDCLGAGSMMAEDSLRSSSVVCLEDTEVVVLPRTAYATVLQAHKPADRLLLPPELDDPAARIRSILRRRPQRREPDDVKLLCNILAGHSLINTELDAAIQHKLSQTLSYDTVSGGQLLYEQDEEVSRESCMYIVLKGSFSQHALRHRDPDAVASAASLLQLYGPCYALAVPGCPIGHDEFEEFKVSQKNPAMAEVSVCLRPSYLCFSWACVRVCHAVRRA